MKAKVFKRLVFLGLFASLLLGCQSIDRAKLQKIKETDQSRRHALIHCSGTLDCQFERLDDTVIVESSNSRVDSEAIKHGLVRLKAKSLKDPHALYLSVPAGIHEVVVRFYPVSRDKAETIHVIHRFDKSKHYQLDMFRDRSSNNGKSLLDVSAPDPLCVDLKQDHKTIRRFCKAYNTLNGLGEFVEQKQFKPR